MKTIGSRSFVALIAVLISALAFSACSEGASKEERYRTALGNISESIRPDTAEWATEVASDMNEQLQARGTIDVESVKGAAALTGEPVADSACGAVKENDDVAALDDPSEPAGEFNILIERELMVATARYPALLYDLKV